VFRAPPLIVKCTGDAILLPFLIVVAWRRDLKALVDTHQLKPGLVLLRNKNIGESSLARGLHSIRFEKLFEGRVPRAANLYLGFPVIANRDTVHNSPVLSAWESGHFQSEDEIVAWD
jgi:hypothetical protein